MQTRQLEVMTAVTVPIESAAHNMQIVCLGRVCAGYMNADA